MNRVYVLRSVRTEEAKYIRRITGTNPFQLKRLEIAPYNHSLTLTCSPPHDNLILIEYEQETDKTQ